MTPVMSPPIDVASERTAVMPRPVRVTGALVFERAGLCAQCTSAPTCTYPCASGVAIRHCDEFNPPPASAARNPASASDTESLLVALPGLCRNCALATRCTYPKPAGGVWLCEEYC
jgi:hypothetical protein